MKKAAERPKKKHTTWHDWSQEEFAARFHIPIETLRDWERGVSEPDDTAKAYLWVIAGDPKMVREALLRRPVSR